MTTAVLKKVSDEEREKILAAIYEARMRGDKKAVSRYSRMLPLHPRLAEITKRKVGVAAMIEQGFNLSEAVEAFGEGWLDG